MLQPENMLGSELLWLLFKSQHPRLPPETMLEASYPIQLIKKVLLIVGTVNSLR